MIYKNVEEGEWTQPVMEGYKMACCDCGLVHTFDFKVVHPDGVAQPNQFQVQFRAWRHNRATGALRSWRKRKESNG